MHANLKKFIYKTLIITGIIITTVLLLAVFLKEFYLPIFPLVVLFFGIVSVVIHSILLKSSEKKANFFINNFMISTISKLFIYLGFVALYLIFDKENQSLFVIFFMINYFIFSAFEVKVLLNDLRTETKENGVS